jgi:hypothetical protein
MTNNTLNPMIADFLTQASKKMFNAAQGGDTDFAEATMRWARDNCSLFLEAIAEGRKNGNNQ